MLTFLRKKTKAIMLVVVVVFMATMFYGVAATRWGGSSKQSNVLVKINGRALEPARFREILNRLLSQFGDKAGPQEMAFLQNLALEQAIDFSLLLARAKKEVRVGNQEVSLAIDNIMKQENIPSKAELSKALKRMGLDESKLKSMIKDEMLVQKMVTKIRNEVKLAPSDLREIKASHILVSKEAEAKALLDRLKKGEDFAQLAKKYSQDPGSGSQGGDLGYFAAGTMVELFDKAAFSLKIGQLSEVVKTDFGYHIIKVLDSRVRKFPGQDKDIEKIALEEKQNKVFQKWFSDIKAKAKIEIINPTLKGHSLRVKGRVWEAIQEYKKAVAAEPGNAYLHLFLADAYNGIGQRELAISEYKSAINLESGNPLLCMILARVYEKDNRTEALELYRKASLLAGENKALRTELLKKFKELKAGQAAQNEQAEIRRIEKKEAFEKELKGE